MKEFIFSYGTLQKEKTQLELFNRLLPGSKDILEGYRLSTIEIWDKVFLARGEKKYQGTLTATNNSADQIAGIVFEISKEELHITDQYEPGNYQRIKVALRSGKEAWIYIAT